MDRRTMIFMLACWPACSLRAQDEVAKPRWKISGGQLQQALSARFPVHAGLGDLLQLQVDAPRLMLLPASQQLAATLAIQASGTQLRPVPAGEVDLAFRLRYEPDDRSLRARDLRILDVRWPGLPPDVAQLLQGVLPDLLRDAVGEVILRRFSPGDLGLADTMGLQPDAITVVDDGIVVSFAAKPLR